ncbi:MAG TPA: SDR family NAD(P)-dependent oxidoreductase [Syntrophomonadaceae bacterium]|nr:SDR family NAD(P)-dependent oxidoreductase [Syntrophomonadaceae bacterium]
MRLKDKIALVTGAGKGIGAAIAKMFAAEGAKVIVFDMDEVNVELVVKEIEDNGGEALGFKVDVTDRATVIEVIKKVLAKFETIDVLVNNAGIARDAMFHKMSEEQWDQVMDVNMKGVFNVTREIVPIMREKQSGSIISISSASRFGNAGQSNYAASKEAIVGFTRAMAWELGPKKVTINAVAPGTIVTDMYLETPENMRGLMNAITPMGRPGTPEEVAYLCLFLASDEASYITGQVIHCDGGIFRP